MSKFKFEKYDDPFRAFNIQMSIICDLEQGGKIDENEAFEQVKALYNQQIDLLYLHLVNDL